MTHDGEDLLAADDGTSVDSAGNADANPSSYLADASRHAPTDEDITVARETAFAVARARNLSVEDAEDLAQTVAERLLREQSVPDNVAAWSRTVTKNAIIDLDRKRKNKHKQADGEEVWAAREVGVEEHVADGLLGVAAFLRTQRAVSAQGMQRQANEEMMQLLREVLSAREMELLMLVGEGRNHADIAQQLGYKNADTVKTTLRRVREKTKPLADRLGEFKGHPRVY